jgi:catechol 2,3-dioxygenase-like lactoylglutathione lyase family enzyme
MCVLPYEEAESRPRPLSSPPWAGPNILSHHATVLLVDDLGRAFDYYTGKLGFEGHKWELNPEHYAYVARGETYVHLACFCGVGARPNHEAVPPDMFDLYIYVDDLDALHQEFVERGAEILNPPVETEYGLREIRVRDADGYVLAFGKLPE